jgi:hypothetical protein
MEEVFEVEVYVKSRDELDERVRSLAMQWFGHSDLTIVTIAVKPNTIGSGYVIGGYNAVARVTANY